MWPFSRKKAPEPEPAPAPPAPPPETELQRLQRELFERVIERKAGLPGIDDWRLEVYAGMYESRTHDALAEDVPHTAKLLGEAFPALVKRYVADVPSTHYSLARLGHGFSKWLREHPVDGARADLAELAALEWARSEAFVADDCTAVQTEEIQQLGPERFTRCWMQFVPSFRILELQHDVLPLWSAMEAKATELPPPAPVPARAIVWRKGFEVFHVAVADDEHAALLAARARENVAAICEKFAGRGDDAAHAAFQAIGSWINEGMIGALREPAVHDGDVI